MALRSLDSIFLVYVAVFALAALACFASVPRARRIEDPDTRRGLVALLLTSGGWASANVAFLVLPTEGLKVAAYTAGLIVGIAAVGPWLYFCSAYTGRTLHRSRTVRRLAVIVYLAVVAVKLTNPLHGLYFTTAPVAQPFAHLAVQHGLVHWLVMGLAYALAFVGYFMLFEMFSQVSADTKPLAVLAGITGLPVLLDVVGLATPYLVDVTYEPLGVAAFAVGVLFLYVERFQAVQVAGSREEAVVVLDEDDRIRDYNEVALELFPDLSPRGQVGEPFRRALPHVAKALGRESSVLEIDREGGVRYYLVSSNPFATGRTQLGRIVGIVDVTERERYRRELERQNDRLEQFASMVSHDLRNPLNVAAGWIDTARADRDDERLEKAADALDRMETLIEDLLAIARQGQPISETEPVSLATRARRAWSLVETGEAELVVEDDRQFEADPDRLDQLFENLFRNSVEHGSTSSRSRAHENSVEHGRPDATVRVGSLDERDGFFVEDDGPGIPEEERGDVFESGYSTADDGTGFGLAIVGEIVDAHGWEIAATEGASGGARFEVTGTSTVEEE